MPFIPHTPEALIGRSDSKNPATTCKGITNSGRPCRRTLAEPKSSGRPSTSAQNGVLAVVSMDNGREEGGAAFYCWQHKDQAQQSTDPNKTAQDDGQRKTVPFQERSSIDTLVARLGVLEMEDTIETPTKGSRSKRRGGKHQSSRHSSQVQRPPTWENAQGPLISVPEDGMNSSKPQSSQRPHASHPPRNTKNKGGLSWFCCLGVSDDDHLEVVRRRRRTQEYNHRPEMAYVPQNPVPQDQSSKASHKKQHSKHIHRPDPVYPYKPSTIERPTSKRHSPRPVQPSTPQDRKPFSERSPPPLNRHSSASTSPDSQTERFVSRIPSHLSHRTTSALLAELSKPFSQYDEPGYIYIFWLTDTADPPPGSAAASLLSPSTSTRPAGIRQTSDILRQYSVKRETSPIPQGMLSNEDGQKYTTEKRTLLLKIGRASNVHRRMNEWTRQCGYSLSLVRWYPYIPSSASPSPATSPSAKSSSTPGSSAKPSPSRHDTDSIVRKVPYAHRVERLIHLELAEKRIKQNCKACGKEHREWFEVEASRDGVRGVDEVVRRWVAWAEGASI